MTSKETVTTGTRGQEVIYTTSFSQGSQAWLRQSQTSQPLRQLHDSCSSVVAMAIMEHGLGMQVAVWIVETTGTKGSAGRGIGRFRSSCVSRIMLLVRGGIKR